MQDNIHINSNKNSAKTPSANSATSPSVISLDELSPESTALSAFLAARPLIRTFIPLFIALGLLSLAFLILTMSRTHAETATASVTVPVSCTMTANPSSGHTTTMNNGTYNEVAAETTLGAACNDNGGYSIYAVGYSDNASGNTNSTSMIGPSISGTSLTIPTCTLANCTSTTPDVSRWAMKLTPISGTSTPTILGDYNDYSPIPLEPTKVITYPAITATDNRSETKATYAVAISSTQPSGTYTGKVKYTIVHPNYANADGTVPPTMQDATYSSLATLMPNVGDSTTLVDSRDGKSYSVAKLADGKYWMTSNLDLPGGTALSPADTDVTSAYIEGFTSGNGLTKSGNAIVLPSSSNSFSTSDNNLAVVYNTGRTTCSNDSTTGSCYSYYSFPAATLGAKDSSGSTAVTGDGYSTSASICPKGWRLPIATTSNASAQTSPNWKTGDFYALATAYDTNLESNYYESAGTFYNNAGPGTTPNFLLSGYYLGASFYGGGSVGYYWSSTSYSSTSAYNPYFSSDGVNSALSSDRGYGFAVRCVFQPTMQDATSSSLAALMPNVGDSTTLVDSRDGKSYSVAKLGDGKYWMTSNLDLPGGTTLSQSDSNLNGSTISYTLRTSSIYGFNDDTTGSVYNSGRTTCSSDSTTGSCYSYYSYVAATAGTNPSSGAASSDICPYGWRLPNYGEYNRLKIGYGSAGLTTSPFYAVYSGYYERGHFAGGGSVGLYWSSTAANSVTAYFMGINSSGFNRDYNFKRSGYAVRCVAKS